VLNCPIKCHVLVVIIARPYNNECLGVGWQVGAENAALKQLVDLMPDVKYSGEKIDIDGGFDPASLLPGNS